MSAAVGLALVAALGWGVADFLGGRRSRAFGLLPVLLGSQAAALVLLAVAVAALGVPPPESGHLLVAVGAGVSELVGVAALYRGTATGRVGVVAPVAAAAPVVPFAVATALGEVPAPVQVAGLAVATAGIVLAAAGPRAAGGGAPAAVAHGAVSAAGFGGFFVLMAAAGEGGVGWALLVARATAVAVLGAVAVALPHLPPGLWVARRCGGPAGGAGDPATGAELACAAAGPARVSRALGPRPSRSATQRGAEACGGPPPRAGWVTPGLRAVPGLVLIGALIVVADGSYAAAAGSAHLGVVAVLGALHTVVTVGLAATVLGERIGGVQAVGIVAALAGAAAVAAV
ncbi:MAG TPA: hypothetical protein VD903_14300 [Pseudonocardia sp.]|nr:hypothetical protein [Pseudonocardia sp.]